MADAISNAVFNGRHGDACGDASTAGCFFFPDGALKTYDSYHERNLPDGRPLAWWFAIRVAWSNAIYPSPDKLMQKIKRLHRLMQLPIDNSVSAGGIWRNILMGSRAEQSLDLDCLRDLINTEVKNLRQRNAC
ncbi:hypothetical protein F5050DRAFT_1715890 [Lentinula boryana]|uniref:Uncharacterized protein n=1 Tax=Lentinula boryana TaxID=40481 RepID=A0ABQ8PZ73_9AGAR|nr:hypothetical protein F5050DRAFT_1715890 [Lentinula boryana]